jgi:hypothetical protein
MSTTDNWSNLLQEEMLQCYDGTNNIIKTDSVSSTNSEPNTGPLNEKLLSAINKAGDRVRVIYV